METNRKDVTVGQRININEDTEVFKYGKTLNGIKRTSGVSIDANAVVLHTQNAQKPLAPAQNRTATKAPKVNTSFEKNIALSSTRTHREENKPMSTVKPVQRQIYRQSAVAVSKGDPPPQKLPVAGTTAAALPTQKKQSTDTNGSSSGEGGKRVEPKAVQIKNKGTQSLYNTSPKVNVKRSSTILTESGAVSLKRNTATAGSSSGVYTDLSAKKNVANTFDRRKELKGDKKTQQEKQHLNPAPTGKPVQKAIHRQSVVYINKGNNKGFPIHTPSSKPLVKVANKAKAVLNNERSSDTQTLAMGITTTQAAVKSFKTAQKVTPTLIKATKGSYYVAAGAVKKTVRVVSATDSTIALLKAGAIRLDKDVGRKLIAYTKNKLLNTRPALAITRTIAKVGETARKTHGYIIKTKSNIKRTVVVVRGIAKGDVRIKITKSTLNRWMNASVRGIKSATKLSTKGVKYVIKGGFKNAVFIGKKVNKGILSISDTMMNTGDMGLQAMGVGLKSVHYTVKGITLNAKAAKYTFKGIKTGVKGIYQTGKMIGGGSVKLYKGVKVGAKVIRKAGVSKAAQMYAKRWSKSIANKAAKAIGKAGRSIATAMVDLIKKLGAKFLIPLLLVIVVLLFGSSMISSVAGAIGAVLSPFISDDHGNTIDENSFMTTEITSKRNELIQDIKDTYHDNLATNGGEYHFIRYFNAFNDTEIDFTDTNINTSIYSVQEYVEAIQPVFHTVILSEYDMSASQTQMKKVLKDMWNTLTVITTTEMPMEYCHMTVDADGTVTPIKDTDNLVHADILTCPNHGDLQNHADDVSIVLASCDYWYYICNKHKGNLVCGLSEHSHTDGTCAYCATEEHTHTSDCCSKDIHTAHTSSCTEHRVYGSCGGIDAHINGCHGWGCWLQYTYWSCGGIHNHTSGCDTANCGGKTEHTHSQDCCSKTEHTHDEWVSETDEGCYDTLIHSENLTSDCGNSTKHKGCNGYYECNGHKILALSISLNSFGDLLQDYFLDEIADLQATSPRTVDEEKRLNDLQNSYEICVTYLNVLEEEYGYGTGTTVVTLDGVTLTPLTDYACSFIGNPYVWGGADPNTGADCSGFVQYVFANFGIGLPRVSYNQVTHGATVTSIADAQAGDLLFWSENGTDSGVYHVAIYLGNGKIVHASNSRPYPSGGIKISNVYGTIYKIKRIY